jgi:hypothetical protein
MPRCVQAQRSDLDGGRDVKAYERLQVSLDTYSDERVIVLQDASGLEPELKKFLQRSRRTGASRSGTGGRLQCDLENGRKLEV